MNSIRYDFVGRFRCVSLKKAGNLLKLLFSYFLSRLFKKPVLLAYPANFSIEPTTACNLKCPECPSGLRAFSRPTGNLTMETFNKSMQLLSPYCFSTTLYFQGEPFINKHFFDFAASAKKNKVYSITSTNGHFLDEENCKKVIASGLNKLIISIDGLSQKTYSKYRIDGEIDKVLSGMKRLSEMKKKLKVNSPLIVAQFIVFKHNEHELKNVKMKLKEAGAEKVQIKTAQIYHEANASSLIPENKEYSRYDLDKEGKVKIKNELLNHCWRMWSACVITWDGSVVPCCFDKDASHKVGNILQVNDFKELVFNEAYMHFRKSLLISRQEIDICKNCSEGTKVFA
jgi:radical SAM protein with 4Fe4S-binding SPASM domain